MSTLWSLVQPQLVNTIKYIISELDELEREDQYRIKKVKDIRTQNEEAEKKQMGTTEEQEERKKKEDEFVRSGEPVRDLLQATQQPAYAVDALLEAENASSSATSSSQSLSSGDDAASTPSSLNRQTSANKKKKNNKKKDVTNPPEEPDSY